MKKHSLALFTALSLMTLSALAQPSTELTSLVNSPTRLAADLTADASRKPIEFLKFTAAQPGMNALDIAAGAGYTSQLLALAAGAKGHVWAQNEKPSANLKARLEAHPQSNLSEIVTPFEEIDQASLPALDLITIVLSYHDIANTPTQRSKMNAQLFKALKPGGHLVLIDHAAKPHTGIKDIKTLHRIDESAVIEELTVAGFQLEAESADWNNPMDSREEHSTRLNIPSDRFALRFVKH
jgi:predicted methyltransferase